MATITYIQSNGSEKTVNVKNGLSVMEGAVKNSIPGIVAECGGSCSCATCQVYVDAAWSEKTGEASPMEREVLDYAPHVRPESRLSCQIIVKDDLDGLKVHVPESQY